VRDGVIAARTADGAEDYLRDLRVRGQTVGDAFLVLGNEKEQFGARQRIAFVILPASAPHRDIRRNDWWRGGEPERLPGSGDKVGHCGLEPQTSVLSGPRSNQLS